MEHTPYDGKRSTSQPYAQGLSRRTFVKGAAAAAAAVAATGAFSGCSGVPAAKELVESAPAEGQWVRTTCAPNCTGSCGMKAFVKDGEIKTIVQASDYPYEHYNPRGCLKGISINTLIHGPERMTAPLVRDENGQMVEADWETALSTAAAKLNDVMAKYGPESVGVIWQVPGTGHVQKGSLVRLCNMMGWSAIGGYELNGDLPMFWPETFGCQSEELESYCWEDSRLTWVFGSNVMVTRLPDSHFLNFSRENGGKVVTFDPNYSPTAEKSDVWVRLAPDSDTVFALAVAKILVDRDLFDHDFVTTFTDLPILINTATGKRILAGEVAGLSRDASIPEYREAYVAYDTAAARFVATNPLHLDDTPDLALEGTFQVPMADGSTVEAKPGFALLREVLEDYTLERAAADCNIPAEQIEQMALEAASVKPFSIIYGGSCFQWHHGDLKGRALSLLVALTGNIGALGAGISTYVGQYKTRFNTASWFMPEGAVKRSAPFHYAVNGRTETMSASFPEHGFKALVVGWGNPFEQHNVANWLRSARESGELECVICMDFQHTKTVDYSDVAFAAASWYEKTELVITPLHPWVQIMQKMVDPPGIAQPEIWIMKELAIHMDPALAAKWPEFDQDGAEQAAQDVLAMLLREGGDTINHITVDDLRAGPCKLAHANPGEKKIQFYEQIVGREPFPTVSRPNALDVTAKFVKSGRIEFYKDEDLFIQLGEQLPIHKPAFVDTECKEDPDALTKYPFVYLTRNSLYRVHATYSNSPFMLELQDNTPRVFLNPDDAVAKGLSEGDVVECYNSRGKISGELVVDPGLYPGQCVFEMGWWSRYTGEESYNTLIWPWINPTHEVYYTSSVWSPNMAWNECLCDVRLVEKGGRR